VKNCQLKIETITVNKIDYAIHSLVDRQQYSDSGQQAAALGISSASWPLFGVVWPASRILAATVCLFDLEGKRVLEIGCGIALSSIVLHQMGVDITASDYHPLAREFLAQNVRMNNLAPLNFQTGNWDIANPLLGKFDLIIGSDILYEPAHSELVSAFVDQHSGNGVEVIIVDPNRGNRSKFTQKMLSLGYSHHFECFNTLDTDAGCKGRILHYHR